MQSRTKRKVSRKQSTKPNVDDYQVVVRWSEEDDCYLAEAPALEGCVTHGATPEEALKEGRAAAELWLTDAWKRGDFIPTPSRRLSGKMTLRLPVSLHQRVAEAAERDGVSVNQWVITHLADRVS